MKLITKALHKKLVRNGKQHLVQYGEGVYDPQPVVKLFNPCGAGTWLLTELDPENEDHAFGLCDLGMGFPELGYVSLAELGSVKVRFGLGIERDMYFKAEHTISEYAKEARSNGRIMA